MIRHAAHKAEGLIRYHAPSAQNSAHQLVFTRARTHRRTALDR
jgi:hypothetical protein